MLLLPQLVRIGGTESLNFFVVYRYGTPLEPFHKVVLTFTEDGLDEIKVCQNEFSDKVKNSLLPLYIGVPKRECLGTLFIFTQVPVQQRALAQVNRLKL